jgi:hypothetical protein
MARDGSEDLHNLLGDMHTVPEPRRLVGQPGATHDIWNGVGTVPESVSQGWKLYVSTTLANFVSTLEVVGPLLRDHGIPFKYLSSLSRVRDQNAGLLGYSQVGKCIVAYLYDESKVPTLLTALRSTLEKMGHEGPFVPRLPAAWRGASVFYRFGSYRGKYVEIAGVERLDDRRDPLSVISLIDVNPFVSLNDCDSGERDGEAGNVVPSVLERFPVVSVICRSGKGGVFRSIDIQEPARTGVIVKIGLRLGSALPDGRDGAHFLDREWRMYAAMIDAGLGNVLARPIAFSEESGANVLVMEEIHGEDLATYRARSTDDASKIAPAIRLIRRIHRAGFSLGDAKAANFILSVRGLVIVDLESANSLSAAAVPLPATFMMDGLRGIGPEAQDIFHFLISLIYPAGRGGSALSQARVIRLPECADEAVAKDAWGGEAIRLLRLAMKALPGAPSMDEFDRALL